MRNWRIYFYQINESLQIDERAFCELVDYVKPSAILLHTYYGVDTLEHIRNHLQELRKCGVKVIEDFTQSLALMPDYAGDSDYAVCSIRKWCAVPDRGILLSQEPVTATYPQNRRFVEMKEQAQKLKRDYLDGKDVDKAQFLQLNSASEAFLSLEYGSYGMSPESFGLLNFIDLQQVFEKRKRNAQIIQKQVEQLTRVRKVLNMDQDTVPLYYPVYTSDRDALQSCLGKKDIFCPILWPRAEAVSLYANNAFDPVYDTMLSLPCDHRYGPEDMQRICDALVEFEYSKESF